MRKHPVVLPSLLVAALAAMSPPAHAGPFDYMGLCDASAAVALDEEHFVVADDETNTLLIYRRGSPDALGNSLDLSNVLDTDSDKEVDLEGAARVGDRIYWIASHSKDKGRRARFFSTKIDSDGDGPRLNLPVKYSDKLVKSLKKDSRFDRFNFKDAAKYKDAEFEGALNIEGLAAGPDGSLLIGFRNPIPDGKALIVPLKNPDEFIDGAKAKFGDAVELDLEGRGVRSLERLGPDDYVIVAGPYNDCGTFALYGWSGPTDDKLDEISKDIDGLNPEAVFAVPGTGNIQLLSDDGGVAVDFMPCKELRDEKEKDKRKLMGFRSRILELE